MSDIPDNDSGADPIDKAYVQAEAVLSDDDARAARRARLLAAVARQPATPLAPSTVPARRPAWRQGGWLAAACVAGLGVFVATQVYRPVPRLTQAAPPAPTPTPGAIAGPPGTPAPAPLKTPEVRPAPLGAATAVPEAPRRDVSPAAPTPPSIEPEREAFPAAPAIAPSPPPPAPSPPLDAIGGMRAAPAPAAKATGSFSGGWAADAQSLARSNANRPASPALEAPSDALKTDRGARLRAAAASGWTAEVEALLNQGAPVDAPDADGDTALMKSIRADHPAVAAILRRHGASLNRKNSFGESAKDLATTTGDEALNRALGLEP